MPRFHRIRLVLLALALAWASPAAAAIQSEAHRAMLGELEQRVDQITMAEDLERLSDSLSAAVKGSADTSRAVALLARALVERRLGHVTKVRDHYDAALRDFWTVARERKDWPYGWYGLGVTKYAMSARRLMASPKPHQPEGSTYAREADVALRRALDIDPDFQPARRANEHALADELLANARHQREDGHLDSTVLVLGQYLDAGGDSTLAFLELARAQFEADDLPRGQEAYYAAVVRARSISTRERLREDLEWIADSAELAQFDALAAGDLRGWITAFWERREVRDMRLPGQRLAEHYRRLGYVEQSFKRVSPRRRSTQGQRYRSHQKTLDDRAGIYMRHGPPDLEASFNNTFLTDELVAPQSNVNPETGNPPIRPDDRAATIPPNVSWKYFRPDGDMVFHFVSETGVDYHLVESLLDVFSLDTIIALQMSYRTGPGRVGTADVGGPAYFESRFTKALLQSRAELDPVYARLANASNVQGSASLQKERAVGQRSLEVGTTTDSYAHRFRWDLEPVIQAFGVFGKRGDRILVVVGMTEKQLKKSGAKSEQDSLMLPARIVLSDELDRRVMQNDTLIRVRQVTQRGRSRIWGGYIELTAPPGRHRLRAAVLGPDHVSAGEQQTENVTLSMAGASRFALSDLILGLPGGLTWAGPAGPVALNPSGEFKRGDVAQLFYTLRGLRPESTYRAVIELSPTGRSDDNRRTTSEFDFVATAPVQPITREVTFTGLKSGGYRLTLTVSGPGGSVVSSRPFRVK